MGFTRKDYYLLAEALAKGKSSPDHEYFVDLIAHDLQEDNPAFKPLLFKKVAGVPPKALYIIIDDEHERYEQIGELVNSFVATGSKPDLHMHTMLFDDGEKSTFLSYQIEPFDA